MAYTLPTEVVTHIMSFLPVPDRKEMALVCKIWYEASLDPILQKDVVIHFYSNTTSDSHTRISGLGRRKMSHMVLNHFDRSLASSAVMEDSSKYLAENLKSLSLKGSNITEKSFVELLTRCVNLTSLDVSCCNSLFMSGRLLEENPSLQKLRNSLKHVKELNLSSLRHLSDALFNRMVTVCENIEKLSIASAKFVFHETGFKSRNVTRCANSSFLSFGNLLDYINIQANKLVFLNLSRTAIEDNQLDDIITIQELQLQELNIASCRNLTDDGISHLCKSQKALMSLNIDDNADLTNSSIFAITEHLSQLHELSISNLKQVTDSAIGCLSRLKKLERLYMSELFQVSCKSISKGLCQKTCMLTHLSLKCCSQIGDISAALLSETQPLLVHLDLASCSGVTDFGVRSIVKNVKNLRYLNLGWCGKITDMGPLGLELPEGADPEKHYNNCTCTKGRTLKRKKDNPVPTSCVVKHLLGQQPSSVKLSSLKGLRHLDLSQCEALTEVGFTNGLKFSELRSLYLTGYRYISDDCIATVVRNNASLEDLNLSGCYGLTDVAIETVVQKLPRLQTLNINHCYKLTDRTIKLIVAYCKRLRTIDVTHCNGMSEEACVELSVCLPTLQNVINRSLDTYLSMKR